VRPPAGGVGADALFSLQSAHVARIPYETVDIVRGRAPGIDPLESVKRVLAGRGGYCYHLNGALSALLAWLDVDVTRHVAGVQGREQEPPGLNANHLGLTARTPTAASGSSTQASGTGPPDRCRSSSATTSSSATATGSGPSETAPGAWRFDHDPEEASRASTCVGTGPIDDFRAMHAFLSTQSGFARTVTAQRRGSEPHRGPARLRLHGDHSADATNVTEITERDVWWDVVITHFGLDYRDLPADERETLWRTTARPPSSVARRAGREGLRACRYDRPHGSHRRQTRRRAALGARGPARLGP
jgi:arylamine N-acetyltransferase